jgi:hypothetical protein
MQNILICTFDEKLLPTKGTPGSVCRDVVCKEAFTVPAGQIAKV